MRSTRIGLIVSTSDCSESMVPARLARFPGAECSNSAGAFPASDLALDSGRHAAFGFASIELRVHTEQRPTPTTPTTPGLPEPESHEPFPDWFRPDDLNRPTTWPHNCAPWLCVFPALAGASPSSRLSASYGQFIGAYRCLRFEMMSQACTRCRRPLRDVIPNSLDRTDRLREYRNLATRYKGCSGDARRFFVCAIAFQGCFGRSIVIACGGST